MDSNATELQMLTPSGDLRFLGPASESHRWGMLKQQQRVRDEVGLAKVTDAFLHRKSICPRHRAEAASPEFVAAITHHI
jgi:hypothetical protein